MLLFFACDVAAEIPGSLSVGGVFCEFSVA